MTMLEKVAAALYEHQRSLCNVAIPAWGETVELKNYWYDLARAAITAMREPTEAMFDAGWNTAWPEGSKFTRPPLYVWEDMIDAALTEK